MGFTVLAIHIHAKSDRKTRFSNELGSIPRASVVVMDMALKS